jgi:Ulp1 family protease
MTPDIRFLLLPVNIRNIHWCLLVVNLMDGRVELWDSLKSPNSPFPPQLRQDRLQIFIRSLSPDTPKLKFSIAEVPQQNGTNCGVFMLEFIRAFVNGQRVGKLVNVSEAQMPEFRARIVSQLKEQEAAAPPLKKRARK